MPKLNTPGHPSLHLCHSQADSGTGQPRHRHQQDAQSAAWAREHSRRLRQVDRPHKNEQNNVMACLEALAEINLFFSTAHWDTKTNMRSKSEPNFF